MASFVQDMYVSIFRTDKYLNIAISIEVHRVDCRNAISGFIIPEVIPTTCKGICMVSQPCCDDTRFLRFPRYRRTDGTDAFSSIDYFGGFLCISNDIKLVAF